MIRRYLWSLFVPLLSLGLFTGTAFARDHGREHHVSRDRVARVEHHREVRREREHERWRHEARERRMREEAHERRARWARHHDRRPPGWDHGQKTGWHGSSVPPGQEKKDIAQSSPHGNHTWPTRVNSQQPK